MKSLFFLALLSFNYSFSQEVDDSIRIAIPLDSMQITEQKGMLGVKSEGEIVVPFKFNELYKVTSEPFLGGTMTYGYMGRKKDENWEFYDLNKGDVVKGIVFDEWIGNNSLSRPWVRVDSTLHMFDIYRQKLASIYEVRSDLDNIEEWMRPTFPRFFRFKSEASGKWGRFDSYGKLMFAFDYDDIHMITDNLYEAGWLVNKDGNWTCYDRFLDLKAENVPIEKWYANYPFNDHSFVLKDGMIQVFEFATSKVRMLSDFPEVYPRKTFNGTTPGIQLLKSPEEKWGAFNKDGELIIDCKYYEIFTQETDQGNFYLARYEDKKGDFYGPNGELILKCDEYPTFLGKDLYIRVNNSDERKTHCALYQLDPDKKTLTAITGYDFLYMNQAIRLNKEGRVAVGVYHDNSEAYIYPDGRIEPKED